MVPSSNATRAFQLRGDFALSPRPRGHSLARQPTAFPRSESNPNTCPKSEMRRNATVHLCLHEIHG
jgi:hypothetical protein